MVSHIGMHAIQSSSHQLAHVHYYDDGNGFSGQELLHSHGKTDTESPEDNLVQLVFLCVTPLNTFIPKPHSARLSSSFAFLQDQPKLFLKKDTPPPQLVLI